MNAAPPSLHRIAASSVSAAVGLLLAALSLTAQDMPSSPFEHDDRAMRQFEFWIGTWGAHPDSVDADRYREVFEWAIPDKAVRKMEFRPDDCGEGWLKVSEALIWYHYGLQEVHFSEPVLDRPDSREVLYTGTYDFGEGDVAPTLVRLNRAFDPDTSSRLYRETYRALGPDARVLTIEVRRDDGSWSRFGEFRAVRRPMITPSSGCPVGSSPP